MMSGRRWAIGALVGLALAGAGCGGEDDPSPPPEEPQAGAVEGAGSSRPPHATPTATEPPVAEEPPVEPLAAREGSVDQIPVELEIVELRRSAATVTLTFHLTLVDEETDEPQVSDTFADGVYPEAENGREAALGNNLDGIELIDGTNRKRHLVARDSSGVCVCDTDLSGVYVTADAPLILSATFAAPPPDVEAMDVHIPTFGVFADVPLS
jgi:hypothetical protein